MILEIICYILGGILFFTFGYAWATKDSLCCIENVQNWIESTNSNRWVDACLYNEMEEKYEKLLKEYNQYQGAIKALQDCNKLKKED